MKWGHSKTTADAELNCGIENVLEINQRWNHFNGKEKSSGRLDEMELERCSDKKAGLQSAT